MISASKLMIGNIVQYKKGHIAFVTSINENDIITVSGIKNNYISGAYHIRDWDYVKPTADILELLGFQNFKHKSFDISILNGETLYILDNVKTPNVREKVEFVHQIQNYFNTYYKPLDILE
jgi:hypothetical protein